MLVVHTPKQNKKNQTQPQINDENGLCSILRKLPISPCLQSGLSLLSNRARGDVPEWRRQVDGGRRSGPSLSSPSLAHCSVSHQLLWPSPYQHAPVAFASILPGGRRVGESDGKGLGAYQLLLLVELQRGPCRRAPGRGRCPGRSPAGFGVLPSSKDAPKPLSISRCVNMANLFYSFSVHYTQRYIYIYTYISLYIDTYRYIYIYYL